MIARFAMRASELLLNLADLNCGEFGRAKHESLAAFRARVIGQAGSDEGEVSKVIGYVNAMKRGDVFPPIFVEKVGSDLFVFDGHHRCAAAALCGQTAVRAVVIKGATREESE